jgi:hypothetical protein
MTRIERIPEQLQDDYASWIRCREFDVHPDHVDMPGHTLIEGKLTDSVIGCFFAVYNSLGFGFLEQVYMAALEQELRARSASSD